MLTYLLCISQSDGNNTDVSQNEIVSVINSQSIVIGIIESDTINGWK